MKPRLLLIYFVFPFLSSSGLAQRLETEFILYNTERIFQILNLISEQELSEVSYQDSDEKTEMESVNKAIEPLRKQIQAIRKQLVETAITTETLNKSISSLVARARSSEEKIKSLENANKSLNRKVALETLQDLQRQFKILQQGPEDRQVHLVGKHKFYCIATNVDKNKGDPVVGIIQAMHSAQDACHPFVKCKMIACFNVTLNVPLPQNIFIKYEKIYSTKYQKPSSS